MDLDELRTVRRTERQKDSLQHLRDSFYEDAATYVEDRKAQRERAAERASDPFSSPEVSRLTDEIETAEEVVEAIYERRVGKVVKLASFAAADMAADTDGLTNEERSLFEDLVDRIKDNRASVLAMLAGEAPPDAGEPSAGSAGDALPDAASEAPSGTGEEGLSTPRETGGDVLSDAMGATEGDSDATSGDGSPNGPDPERRDVPPDAPTSEERDAPPDAPTSEERDAPLEPESETREAPPDEADTATRDVPPDEADTATRDVSPDEPDRDARDVPPDGPDPAPAGSDPAADPGPASGSRARGAGTTGSDVDSANEPRSPQTGSGPADQRAEAADAGSPSPEVDRSDAVPESSSAASSSGPAAAQGGEDRLTVRITEDVGRILGVDEREYDLVSEDVVTLPATNAEPLLQRDAAERLE